MVKLICVTADNNNKFYYMNDLGDGNFEVEYGRVGSTSTKLTYSSSLWDKKYNEKIKKGYIDVSSQLSKSAVLHELDITDPEVKDLISFLMSCAKQSIKSNYEISIEEVSQLQIDNVQDMLDWLAQGNDKNTLTIAIINDKLRQVYTIIPRKMRDTRYHFISQSEPEVKARLNEILQNEQSQLDTLKSQIKIAKPVDDKLSLNVLGFNCEVASDADRELIKNTTDFKLTNHKVFKISNKETEKIFNPNKLDTKLLYHGSRNENFLSILQTGLKIRPSGVVLTGSMFGNGIYAANKAQKSIGYTSLKGSYWASGSSNKGYLAIFEFATGKEWNLFERESYRSWMGNLDNKKVSDKGFDSVFAKGGADLRNDEYIVYNSNQATIRYLIELTN